MFQSSHPAIEIRPNLMKTITENIFNRHTHARVPIHVAHPVGRDEAFSCARRRLCQSEEKTKGEEKANRNRRPLKNP